MAVAIVGLCRTSPRWRYPSSGRGARRSGEAGRRALPRTPRTPNTVFALHGVDLYDHRAIIVATLATAAIITDPDDITSHLDPLAALELLTRYGEEAREIITGIRDGYTAH